MGILSTYLLRVHISLLPLVLVGLVGINLVAFAFEKIDDVVDAGTPASIASIYFLLSIPRMVETFVPAAVVLSSMLAIAVLARHNELLSFRTLGVGPWGIGRPFFLCSAVISVLTILFSATVVPLANSEADDLWRFGVEKKELRGVFQAGHLYYHGNHEVWSAGLGSPDGASLRDVDVVSFGDTYQILTAIHAEAARFDGKAWTFVRGTKKARLPGEAVFSEEIFETLTVPLEEKPGDFVAVQAPLAHQTPWSLWTGMKRLRGAGYVTAEQEIHFWSQILYPFLGLTLLAASFPLILVRGRGGVGVGFVFGLGVCLGGLALWNIAIQVGLSGHVSPVLPLLCVHGGLVLAGMIQMKKSRF